MGHGDESPQRKGFVAYADRLRLLNPRSMVARSDGVDRVVVIDAPGHTPGHIGLEVISGDERMWLLVDTAHSLVQMAHPEWNPRYDMEPETAQDTRARLFGQAAEKGIPILMYHFPFPGIGRIESKEGAFAFIPA